MTQAPWKQIPERHCRSCVHSWQNPSMHSRPPHCASLVQVTRVSRSLPTAGGRASPSLLEPPSPPPPPLEERNGETPWELCSLPPPELLEPEEPEFPLDP